MAVSDAVRKIKAEISKKASMANKRLVRLEKNNLTDLPVYRNWVEDGAVKFSVKNKTYNELQQELARVNQFINNKTTLVRGAHAHLKDIASKVGLKYTRVRDLNKNLSDFFRVASKVEEYLGATQNSAVAIGYHKIWEVINEYVETQHGELGTVVEQLDGIEQLIDELLVSDAFLKSTQQINKKISSQDFWDSL